MLILLFRFLKNKLLDFYIQTNHHMSPLKTNFYDRTTHCYWSNCNHFNQSEFDNLSSSITRTIIQNRTGSWVLKSLYISTSISKVLVYLFWVISLFISNYTFLNKYRIYMLQFSNYHSRTRLDHFCVGKHFCLPIVEISCIMLIKPY